MDLAELMHPPHKLCRFLHMPLQSGSDRILRRMGRRYVREDVAMLLQSMWKNVPGILLGTDIIAGFPGETDQDFEMTMSFLEEQPLHYFHVFSYSDRQKARSRSFKGAVAHGVICERADRVRRLGRGKQENFLMSLVGSTQEVLFEYKKHDVWVGHTDNYITITASSQKDLHNTLVPVKIVRSHLNTLSGVI